MLQQLTSMRFTDCEKNLVRILFRLTPSGLYVSFNIMSSTISRRRLYEKTETARAICIQIHRDGSRVMSCESGKGASMAGLSASTSKLDTARSSSDKKNERVARGSWVV